MWTFMLNPNFGIFNTIENIFGLHGTIPDVLTIKTVNVWIVVLVNEWMYAGYNMLIFAAGLVAGDDKRRPERYQLHAFNHALYTGILL